MADQRAIHPDFLYFLKYKDQQLIDLYVDLRAFILGLYPASNEILYRTHALSSVYTLSEKLSDAFCVIPVYTNHLNLGFNKGTLLQDPDQLLQGTGKLIRHIPIINTNDYRNDKVIALINNAVELAKEDVNPKTLSKGITISKIKIG